MKSKISAELMDELTAFLLEEIDIKAKDGITYALALKKSDYELIERCKEIKQKANKEGFESNQLFRIYELSNGYIFDMDLSITKMITQKLAKVVEKDKNIKIPPVDLIGNTPEERRKDDMKAMAKYCVSQFEKRVTNLELALFSRNSVPKIVITANDKKTGQPVAVTYNAYAIRHWDLEEINRSLLAPKGIRIASVTPCEVLPSKTGVRFEIKLARA